MPQEMAHEMKDIDERILEALATGRNVPSNLAEQLDVSRQWISQRLQQMESADYVTNVGRGVYELQPENIPSEQRDRLDLETTEDAAGLEHKLDNARDELEELREENQRLKRKLNEANTQNSVDVDRVERALDQAETAAERGDPQALQDALDDAREVLENAE